MAEKSIQTIQGKIKELTQRRSDLFEEWAALVKKNDRDFELNGKSSPELVKKADKLLQQQREIGNKIMKLMDKIDS